jgi:hypothetical protein
MFTLQFWEHNNRWRAIAFPMLFLMATPKEQLLDAAYFPGGAFALVVYLLAVAFEIVRPSQIDYMHPHYGAFGRVGFGLLYGFCWTAWGLAAAKAIPLLVVASVWLLLSLLSLGRVPRS